MWNILNRIFNEMVLIINLIFKKKEWLMHYNTLIISNNEKEISQLDLILKQLDIKCYNTLNQNKSIEEIILFKKIQIVICDFDDLKNEKLMSEINVKFPFCCFIAISNSPSMMNFVAALDAGAWDYISYPTYNQQAFVNCIISVKSRINRWLDNKMLFSNIKISGMKIKINKEISIEKKVHNSDSHKLLSHFVSETTDILQQILPSCKMLQIIKDDITIIDDILNSIKNLKENAPFFGLMKVRKLSKNIEKMLEIVKLSEVEISDTHIDLLLEGLNFLLGMLMRSKDGLSEIENKSEFVIINDKMNNSFQNENAMAEMI